ncbi:helix-turn-helix transcriptional regulator [Nocardioides humi]|uniref:helix-turn-helix transcriptional regulator n=1 Tax=Nocardioides humi TaxID=449461 RepID=UPI0011291B04|nr:MarR family transcriptional regulator [Nocardioides humi]
MTSERSELAPGSTASLRAANQRRVLDALRASTDGDAATVFTQAELARVTGLARATVSNIVRDLGQAGLVETEAGSGRRGSAVRLSPGRASSPASTSATATSPSRSATSPAGCSRRSAAPSRPSSPTRRRSPSPSP